MKKLLMLALLPMGFAPQEAKEADDLIVHEWGTFTTVAGADGASLEWRPLAGPSDLPSFVYQIGGAPKGLRHGAPCPKCRHFTCGCGSSCTNQCKAQCKSCMVASVRMETPVLYFYANRETTVSVRVDFPKGRITEWYPQAREVGSGIDWGGVRLRPGAKEEFPRESTESHYYPARETDAVPLCVCGNGREHEKFLFYRGAGTFDLPISVTKSGDEVTVRTSGEIPFVAAFENRAGQIRCVMKKEAKGEVTLNLKHSPWGIRTEFVAGKLEEALRDQELYLKEAEAMIRTWRDSWFEEGVRVFYIVPRKVTDSVLPLTIEPRPKELVRVLVGRVEILTPEMEQAIRDLVEKLGDDSIESREASTKALAKYGRFAEPLLKRVLASAKDPEVQSRIRALLGE